MFISNLLSTHMCVCVCVYVCVQIYTETDIDIYGTEADQERKKISKTGDKELGNEGETEHLSEKKTMPFFKMCTQNVVIIFFYLS